MKRRGHNQRSTKRDLIAKIVLDPDSKLSAREIARSVGTTEGNVFKEKSRLRSTGILADRQVSIFSHSDGDDIVTLARAEAKTLVTQTDYRAMTDIPPLRQDDLKKLYAEFKSGKTPVEVIAENGFNPTLVEYEFKRFSRLNGFNPSSFLKDIVDKYNLIDDQAPGLILPKIQQNGFPSNADLMKMIEAVSALSISQGEVSLIERMRTGIPIGTFKPYLCAICHQPMIGLMFDERSEIGIKVRQAIGNPVHDRCNIGSGWNTRT